MSGNWTKFLEMTPTEQTNLSTKGSSRVREAIIKFREASREAEQAAGRMAKEGVELLRLGEYIDDPQSDWVARELDKLSQSLKVNVEPLEMVVQNMVHEAMIKKSSDKKKMSRLGKYDQLEKDEIEDMAKRIEAAYDQAEDLFKSAISELQELMGYDRQAFATPIAALQSAWKNLDSKVDQVQDQLMDAAMKKTSRR